MTMKIKKLFCIGCLLSIQIVNAVESSRDEALNKIYRARHILLFNIVKGEVVSSGVINTANMDELSPIYKELKRNNWGKITSSCMVCYYPILSNGKKVGLNPTIYNLIDNRMISIGPDLPLIEIGEVKKHFNR